MSRDARAMCAPALVGATTGAYTPSSAGTALKQRLETLLNSPSTACHTLAVIGLTVRMVHARGGAALAAPFAVSWLPVLLPRHGASYTTTLFDLALHSQPRLPPASVDALLSRACRDAADASSAPKRLAALLSAHRCVRGGAGKYIHGSMVVRMFGNQFLGSISDFCIVQQQWVYSKAGSYAASAARPSLLLTA